MLFNRSSLSTLRQQQPLSNDQIYQLAPSVFADHKHHSRGNKYAFVSTHAVLEGLRKEGFQPFSVVQTRCRLEDKRPFTKHLIRFRHPDAAQALKQIGDEIPEIVLVNSHDGTSSYQVMGGVFRLVCLNGMIVGDPRYDVKVRHTGNIVDEVIEGSFSVIDKMKSLVYDVADFKETTVSSQEAMVFAEAAHQLRWEPEDHAPIEAPQLLTVKRLEDNQDDLWTTFNVIQENLIKGGLEGKTATDRKTTTRAVAGVSENVKLNRALWVLTQKFNELKAIA